MTIGTNVKATKGTSSMGAIFITQKTATGTVVRVNRKSIRVLITKVERKVVGKTVKEMQVNEMNYEVTFELSARGYYIHSEFGILEEVK